MAETKQINRGANNASNSVSVNSNIRIKGVEYTGFFEVGFCQKKVIFVSPNFFRRQKKEKCSLTSSEIESKIGGE